jgi:rhodanese-related sulfurtransferase
MKLISPTQLRNKLKNNDDFQLIDIRESYEFEDGAIGELNIPLDDMMNSLDKIAQDKQVVIYCKSGNRASSIIYMLEKKHQYTNLYTLEGGYTAFLELE